MLCHTLLSIYTHVHAYIYTCIYIYTYILFICEQLADKNPRNYLALAPRFFRLLTTSSNNWMLIKVRTDFFTC
jgi:hypothetical protein